MNCRLRPTGESARGWHSARGAGANVEPYLEPPETTMRLIQRFISAGFATAALASASVPALGWSVWPDVDFEWYANVGKPVAAAAIDPEPAPRAGSIWQPAHWERRGERREWVAAHWVRDDYREQLAEYARPVEFASAPPVVGEAALVPAYPTDTRR